MQASSFGNYIAEEAFKNSFVQQSPLINLAYFSFIEAVFKRIDKFDEL